MHIYRAFLALFGLLFMLAATAVAQDSGTPSTVFDLTADYDGDDVPDRAGMVSIVSGKVTVTPGAVPGQKDAIYIQDDSGGILVKGVQDTQRLLSTVRLVGTLREDDAGYFLQASTIERGNSATKVSARPLTSDNIDDIGFLVQVTGRVVEQIDIDTSHPGLVLATDAGLVIVRTNTGLKEEHAVGQKLASTGVLVSPSGVWPNPQILTSNQSQLVAVLDYQEYRGLAQKALAGLAILLLLGVGAYLWTLRPSKRDPFKIAVLQAEASIVFTDLSGKIFFANPAASALCERSKKQLQLMKIGGLFSFESDWDTVISELKNGQTTTLQGRLSGSSSKSVDVHVTRTEVKKNPAVLLVIQDISTHRQSLSQFKQFYEKLLSGLPLAVSVMSTEGRYLFVNELEFGDRVNPETLVGKSDIECAKLLGLSTEVTLRRRAHRRRAVNTKVPVKFDEEIDDGIGTKKYVRIYQPLTDASGSEVVAVATYGLDVTELRQSQTELDSARIEIGKVNHIKELLIENLNSEFRKPISGIIGFAEILEGEVNEEQREFVNHIERNGRRLMNTLNSVLDLAGLKNHDVELQIGVVDLVEQAREITELSRDMAEEKGLFIELRPERPSVYGRGDSTCVTRIMQNLIDNAIKFTESGGVIVEVGSDDHAVQIRVIDSGAGIDSSFLPFVFDDFNQELPPSAMTGDGVGIGLGVTKRLVELMQGSVVVESKKGEGSTFVVNIPRAFPYRSAFTAGRPRLLYVDSSEESRSIVSYLMNEHFSVDVASSLDELATLSGLTKYDLLVADVSQPDFNMWVEWLQVFRQKCDSYYVPVVATDDPRNGAMTRALDAGFDYFIAKPYKKDALTNLLSQVMMDRKRLGDIHSGSPDRAPTRGASYNKAS